MSEFICKIADFDELIRKCDYEINRHPNNNLWVVSKENAITCFNENSKIMYIGILDNEIVCEATAVIKIEGMSKEVLNSEKLFDENTAYLCAFRTNKNVEGKGYFSKLYKFMENDLKRKGFKRLTLGVEPCEVRNIQIYFHLGFTTYVKTTIEELPAKDEHSLPKQEIINYYSKTID